MKKVYYVIEIDGVYFKSRNFLDKYSTVDKIEEATTFDNYFDARDLASKLKGKPIRLKKGIDK